MSLQRQLLLLIVGTLWGIYSMGWLATLKLFTVLALTFAAIHLLANELRPWLERGRKCSHCGECEVRYDSGLGSDFCRACRHVP